MDPAPTLPAFKLNDDKTLERVPTEQIRISNVESLDFTKWQNASFPDMSVMPTESKARLYENMLRENGVEMLHNTDSGECDKFWPLKLLEYILNPGAVLDVLTEVIDNAPEKFGLSTQSENRRELTIQIGQDLTRKICGANGHSGFRRILAILLLLGEEHLLGEFITQDLADHNLPVARNGIRFPSCPSWSPRLTEVFFGYYQPKFAIPFFAPSPATPQTPPYIKIGVSQIKPWIRTSTSNGSSQNITIGGGYGEVHQVIIHPWQHGFHAVLSSLSAPKNLFAIKVLISRNEEERDKEKAFERETQMLTRFGGDHGNIVTLLATISWDDISIGKRFALLFPWAECDLLGYWRTVQQPKWNFDTIRWIAGQCHGIISAIHHIHNPHKQNDKNEELYGRHGDIKPENILWFKKKGKGVLVLSDLGLAAEHRDTSRSNIPGHDIPHTPNYRPPECDMNGSDGFISRSFDIWTLGCLFLEFIVWTLCGWEERETFRIERCSLYINGIEKDIYFDVCRVSNKEDSYAFKIKDSVTERFARLHGHPNCSRFFHEFLDLIQTQMLIVESDVPHVRRIKAGELLREIENMTKKCERELGYCLFGEDRKQTEHRVRAPVEVELNQTAKDTISGNNMRGKLALYDIKDGRTRSAKPRSERLIRIEEG